MKAQNKRLMSEHEGNNVRNRGASSPNLRGLDSLKERIYVR